MTDEIKKDELNEQQLESVSGGKIEWASRGDVNLDKGEKATFAFNIGDHVEVYNCWFFGVRTTRGTIVTRFVEGSNGCYYPRYGVQLDSSICGTVDRIGANQDYLSY